MRYRDDFRGAGRGPILAQSRFIAVKKRLQSVLRYRGFICDFIIFYTFQHAFQPPIFYFEDGTPNCGNTSSVALTGTATMGSVFLGMEHNTATLIITLSGNDLDIH